jgi:hypothetical protein
MLDVDESVDENNSSGEDPITSNITPLNSLMMTKFHIQDCCLIRRFDRFKGLTMAMQI